MVILVPNYLIEGGKKEKKNTMVVSLAREKMVGLVKERYTRAYCLIIKIKKNKKEEEEEVLNMTKHHHSGVLAKEVGLCKPSLKPIRFHYSL